MIFTAYVFPSLFRLSVPEFVPLLLTVTVPVPCPCKARSQFVVPPPPVIMGAVDVAAVALPPAAALVTASWFTALEVVRNVICSWPFSSIMPFSLSRTILLPLPSKLPPRAGLDPEVPSHPEAEAVRSVSVSALDLK